jgi:tellurite resistance protein TerC
MSSTAVYLVLAGALLPLLAVDLVVSHRRTGQPSLRSSATWSAVWILAALAFGVVVLGAYAPDGDGSTTLYLTAYLVEKSLSFDNVFLFLVVFQALAVPPELQRRVLFWGVLGAFVFRTGLVLASSALVETFSFVLWVAGAFLVVAAVKLWRERHESETDLTDAKLLRFLHRVLPTTDGYRGSRFVVREHGRWLVTPLFLALVFVELTDVVLALDALPGALSVTSDPVILLSANLFALLGLRSLYFLLVAVAGRLRLLKSAVAVILAFIGVSLILENAWGAYHVSTLQSLLVIVAVLTVAVVRSVTSPEPGDRPRGPAEHRR